MKRIFVVSIVLLILAACAPMPTATPLPAPTATLMPLPTNTLVPTATSIPTSMPTNTPTITPTPFPSIVVSGLALPDPRVTNPELFDLRNPDAPIPQFVYAMKIAGIVIAPEKIAQSLQYRLLKNASGMEFVIGYFLFEPDVQKPSVSFKGPVPILIATKVGAKWVWKEAMLKDLAEPINFLIGTGIGGMGYAQYYDQMVKSQTRGDFNLGLLGVGARWNANLTPPPPAPIFYKYLDSDVSIAQKAGMIGYGHLLLWGKQAPQWLREGKYSRDEVVSLMQESIRSAMNRYQGKIKFWNIVNEPYDKGSKGSDVFLDRIGPEYVEIAFRTARESDPTAVLMFNDYANHTVGGRRTPQTKKIADDLKSKQLLDMVGLETILSWPDIPTKEQLIEGMRYYGLPIMVTEFVVNMGNFNDTSEEKFATQAKIYYDTISACLESGVCRGFIMFLTSDAANFWNDQADLPGASPKNDPSPFDRNFRPKPAYYMSRMALMNYMLSLQK